MADCALGGNGEALGTFAEIEGNKVEAPEGCDVPVDGVWVGTAPNRVEVPEFAGLLVPGVLFRFANKLLVG